MKKQPLPRPLLVEGLERRELLAGNVLVESHNGNVKITGDGDNNGLIIAMQLNGRFNITSQVGDDVFTGPTTDLEIRNLTVNLLGGNDFLIVAGDVSTGLNNPAFIPGKVKIDLGAGNDNAFMAVAAGANGEESQSISVKGGDGNDTSLVLFSAVKSVSIEAGVGDDAVVVSNSSIRNIDIDTGVNTLGEGETDNDAVQLGSLTAQTINVRLGTGNQSPDPEANSFNFANVYNSSIGVLNIQGGDAVDSMNVHDNTVDAITISTGGSDDTVEIARVEAGLLHVNLGGGDDTLYAYDSDITIATLLGGSGTDGRWVQNVDSLLLLELQFETVLPPLF
ncbi:hypothetical protein [Anatilimnocola floriformis]|uniref:hypothetical protein n=1 Tax=Anatilimnocola floriformis TaxID=2948575 RepID=UPI0020C29B67|nr:hypothetical protein [Anatilimnocola floriformis]